MSSKAGETQLMLRYCFTTPLVLISFRNVSQYTLGPVMCYTITPSFIKNNLTEGTIEMTLKRGHI